MNVIAEVSTNSHPPVRELKRDELPDDPVLSPLFEAESRANSLRNLIWSSETEFGNEFNEFCKTVVEKGECEFYTTVRDKKTLSVEGKAALASLKQQPPQHTEEICAFAKEKTMCGYELAIALAKDAHVIVCDYFFQHSVYHFLYR